MGSIKCRGKRWGCVAPPGKRGYNGRRSAIQDRAAAEVTALQLDLWARGLGEDGARELMTIRSVCGENAYRHAGKQQTRYLHWPLFMLCVILP